MKNLKKILLALALVALLISSVVTIAIAEASYTGSVTTARDLLSAADADSPVDALSAKSAKLGQVYTYLTENPVNPEDEGYDALIEEYNAMTFKVAYLYFKDVGVGVATDAEKSEQLAAVYKHLAIAPCFGSDASDFEIALGYTCMNDGCGASYTFNAEELFEEFFDGTPCPGDCSASDADVQLSNKITYAEFETMVNEESVGIVGLLLDNLYSSTELYAGSDAKGYYDLINAQKDVVEFYDSFAEIDYVGVVSKIYNGDVAVVNEMLASLSADSTYAEMRDVLAEVYTYLVKTPANPTTDEFYSFIHNYKSACDLMAEKLGDEVDAVASVDGKIALLVEFADVLTGKDGATPVYFTENVVAAYNEICNRIRSEFELAGGVLDSFEDLVFESTAIEFDVLDGDAMAQLVADLEYAESLPVGGVKMEKELKEMYSEYILGKSYDINDEEIRTYFARYAELACNFVTAKYIDGMRALAQISDRYDLLAEFRELVIAMPIEEVVNVYNEARIVLRDDALAMYDKIGSEKLPVYVKPENKESTISYDILDDFYNDLKKAYDKYNVASAEDMAADLSAMQNAATALYNYIIGSVMNESDEEYAAFAEKYNTLRDDISATLIAKIDAAQTIEEKLAEIQNARAFLAAAPISFSIINTYNNKVSEIIVDPDMLEAYIVPHVLYNVKNEIDVLTNSASTRDELLASGLKCVEYFSAPYDITDGAFAAFKEEFEESTNLIGDAIYLDLLYAINYGTTEELLATVDFYLNYVNEVYTYQTVLGVRKALKVTGDTCKVVADKIDKNYSDVASMSTEHANALDLLEYYKIAETFEEKFEIFMIVYAKMHDKAEYLNAVFMYGESYAEFKAGYDAVYAEIENVLISYADSSLSPAVLCDNLAYIASFHAKLGFSENVVNAYNETLAAAKEKGYSTSAEEILASCPVVEYATPEDYSDAYSRLYIALERAEKALADGGEYDFAEYYIALLILGGNNEAAVKLDFASNDFIVAVEYFNKVTNDVKNYLFKVLDSNDVVDIDDKRDALEAARNFIVENCFSENMVNAYNEYIDVLYAAYQDRASSNFESYEVLMAELHAHLEACPVKESALSATVKALYSSHKTLIEAAEYGEFGGYLDYFENLSGDTVLIYQNMIVDKLNWYTTSYGLGSYSEAMLVNANLQVMMNKYFDAFDEYLATIESEISVKNEVVRLGAALRIMGCSSELIRIYNVRYGQSIAAGDAVEKTGTGNLSKYSEYVAAIDSAIANTDYANIKAKCDAIRATIEAAVEYVNLNNFDSSDVKEGMMETVETIRLQLAENTAEQKKELNNSAPLSEFNNQVQIDYNHQDGKLYASSLGPSSDTSVRYMTLETEANGNKYAQMKVTTSSGPYFNMTKNNLGSRLDDTNGLVIDLDVMSPEVLNFQLTFTEDGLNTGKRVTTRVLQIKNNQLQYLFGEYSKTREESYYPNYVEGVDAPITLTPGEWMHVTIIMDIEEMMMELLVDYVSLGRKPIITAASSGGDDDTCRYGELRFQCSAANTTACFDNVLIYGGTAYRTLDYIESMDNDQKFEFYVNNALDPNEDAVNRVYAYAEAKALMPYISSACDEIKAVFESFDINNIKADAHEQHIKTLTNIVAPIDLDTLNSGNASTMNVAVSNALAYIDANRLYIDQADERFVAINEILVAANARTAWLSNLEDYIEVIGRFHRATSHASLVRHFEEVQNYFLLCELNKADKLELAMNDPIATTFVNSMLKDESVQRLAPDMTFIEYYTVYAPARITEQLHIENSGWILEYVAAIESIVPNKDELSREEYLEVLAILAEDNADFVDPYMTAIRNIVNAEAFDYSIEGVAEALEIFELLDEVFFNALQEVHYSIIKEQLDKYLLTDSYIEKAGICAFIDNYIEKNAVDMSDSRGQQYLYSLNVYKAEIELYKKDYEAILAANTEAFIATVGKMSTYVTYSEIKPLYDLAIEKYYYNMNADSEEVRAAIALFETYEKALTEWEYNGAMFINYVNNYVSYDRQAQKYRALVNCAKYVDYIDVGVDGVEEALAIYVQGYADYVGMVDPVNKDLSGANDIVCAVRVESISASVLAIVKNLMTR